MATLPSVQNDVVLENYLLEALRERAVADGFTFLSTFIEERMRDTGPWWLRDAVVLERIEGYLRGGATFVYLQASLGSGSS
jgi:hypothetical protein